MRASSVLVGRVEEGLSALFAERGETASDPTSRLAAESLQAHAHPVLAGGKRVRPVLLLLTAGAISGKAGVDVAMPAALALELVHTYSLVHDDLPCMDNDDFRRGKPTTHKLYGEAKGLLVGDGLLTRAFSLLGEAPLQLVKGGAESCLGRLSVAYSRAAAALAHAAGHQGMVLGQWLDMTAPTAETRASWGWVERVAHEKTGRLLGAALEMGVILGMALRARTAIELASDLALKVAHEARACGIHAGIAFQCVDDVLDVTATSEAMGKTVGKDEAQSKATAVTALGLEGARAKAREHTELALAKLALLKHDLFHCERSECSEVPDFAAELETGLRDLLERRM